MKYKEWEKRPTRFLSMTGYTIENFEALYPYFEEAHNAYLREHRMTGQRRSGKRIYVMYSNTPLADIRERLAFILCYLKNNPTQEMQADLFGIEQRQCCEFVHGLRTILDIALESAAVMPARTNEELQEVLSANKNETNILFHDGTEREIPRPQDDEEQKANYSGKKKRHTVKNAVIVSCCSTILFVSQTLCGNVHDKRIADENYTIPPGIVLYQDSGYQGFRPEGVNIIQPTKKPKGKELTEEQKAENRKISSVRVLVEHVIGSTKRCRIVKDECRLRKNDFVKFVYHTCAALHNFRVKTKPFRYEFN